MVCKLSKSVTRRVSDMLVVSMTRDGLVLRHHRGRRRVILSWDFIEESHLFKFRKLADAFSVDAPSRWIPAAGERVLVRPSERVLVAEVRRVLRGCGDEIVVCWVSGKKKEVRVLRSQTRPWSILAKKRVVTPKGDISTDQ